MEHDDGARICLSYRFNQAVLSAGERQGRFVLPLAQLLGRENDGHIGPLRRGGGVPDYGDRLDLGSIDGQYSKRLRTFCLAA